MSRQLESASPIAQQLKLPGGAAARKPDEIIAYRANMQREVPKGVQHPHTFLRGLSLNRGLRRQEPRAPPSRQSPGARATLPLVFLFPGR